MNYVMCITAPCLLVITGIVNPVGALIYYALFAREHRNCQPRRGSNSLRPACYHLNRERTSKQGVIN